MPLKGLTASELAAHVDGRVTGDGSVVIARVASLDAAGEGDISYVEDQKFFEAARNSKASCLIVQEGAQPDFPCQIRVKNPKLAFALIAEVLHPPKQRAPEIHSSSVIAADAKIGRDVFIGAFVCVGENSTVGDRTQIRAGVKIGDNVSVGTDCVIHPNVFIEDGMTIGNRVILHAGVVIGADGFGYVRGDMGHHKFPQIGTVVIEDDVELGANTTVDRGALGRTRIGKGTKLDNMVHVGHSCTVGEDTLLCAQVGLAGTTDVGNNVVLAGQVGVAGHCKIGDGVIAIAQSGIPHDVPAGKMISGAPAIDFKLWLKCSAAYSKLPELVKAARSRTREE